MLNFRGKFREEFPLEWFGIMGIRLGHLLAFFGVPLGIILVNAGVIKHEEKYATLWPNDIAHVAFSLCGLATIFLSVLMVIVWFAAGLAWAVGIFLVMFLMAIRIIKIAMRTICDFALEMEDDCEY